MDGVISRLYDKYIHGIKMDEVKNYAKEVASHLIEGDKVLEVACGPGYISIELDKLGSYCITGIDISTDMIEISKINSKRENANIKFIEGNVSSMPFEDNTFEFVFCILSFKMFKTPVVALQEIYRVLKKDGIALIVDMRRDFTKKGLDDEVGKFLKPGFMNFCVKKIFESILKSTYVKEEIIEIIKQTHFTNYEIKESEFLYYAYLNKHY
jgi:ubiquinone/menaquinone biosynthesis C-methylase UbiE